MNTVVVGYDGSDNAKLALSKARELAGHQAKLIVVYAYRVPEEMQLYEFFEDLREAYRKDASEVLKSAREVASGAGGAVEYETRVGKPADELVAVASEQDADLIVVGSRGLSKLRAALGSVTHRLLHEARCPVLVVPDG